MSIALEFVESHLFPCIYSHISTNLESNKPAIAIP